jgi:hypothetical protein
LPTFPENPEAAMNIRDAKIGDEVRHCVTGKTYRVREIKTTRIVVQRGSTAIEVAAEKLEPISKS